MRALFINETYSFERGGDPRQILGIGLKRMIDDWLDEMSGTDNNQWYSHNYRELKYQINPDSTVDILDYFNISSTNAFREIPEWFIINRVHRDFNVIGNPNLKNVDNLPKIVDGDFLFWDNGVRLTEKTIRDRVDVKGRVQVLSYEAQSKKEANDRWRALGPRKDRPSPIIKTMTGGRKIYSNGYIIYSALKGLYEAGDEGLRYTDLIRIMYEITRGKGTFNSTQDRGYGSGFWESGIMQGYTTSNKYGKYILNQSGLAAYNNYKSMFKE